MTGWVKRTVMPVLITALCASLPAQDTKTITVRVLDGRNGHPIAPTGFQVRVDRITTIHGDWVKQNEDGTGEVTLPLHVSSIALRFSYDANTEMYINCDGEKPKGQVGELWYSVIDILDKGIIVPNTCVSPKHAAKIKMPELTPGEIVYFVRQKNWHELGEF